MNAKPLNDNQIVFLLRIAISQVQWVNGRLVDTRHQWSVNTLDAMIRRGAIRLPHASENTVAIQLTDEGARLVRGLVTSWPHLAERAELNEDDIDAITHGPQAHVIEFDGEPPCEDAGMTAPVDVLADPCSVLALLEKRYERAFDKLMAYSAEYECVEYRGRSQKQIDSYLARRERTSQRLVHEKDAAKDKLDLVRANLAKGLLPIHYMTERDL